jgi:hypothetical protein
LAFADSRPKGLDVAISATALQQTREVSRVYDAVVRSRGVVLDELAARAHGINLSDPSLAALERDIALARERYANLALRVISGGGSVPAERLEDARKEKEQAERALAERSAEARGEIARSAAGVDEIRRALPSGSTLVSFIKYERTRLPLKPTAPSRPLLPSYAAFVMTGGATGQTAFVPLGYRRHDRVARARLAHGGACRSGHERARVGREPLS